jgi:hypothetical protein
MSPAKRWLLKAARTVHVYATLFGLVLLLFFAVTGFMLNHEKWFGLDESQEQSVEGTGVIPMRLLQPVDKFGLAELLRKDYGASGEADIDDSDPQLIRAVFKGPGRKFDARIDRADGKMDWERRSKGLAGLLADLHRSKSVGVVWPWVIDAVCMLLLLISTTGLILWWSLRSRGRFGILTIGLGLVASVTVYLLWVPWR